MLFFPYKADLEQWRLPLVTLLICALCLLVFAYQESRKIQLDASVIHFCSTHQSKELDLALGHLATVNRLDKDSLCLNMLRHVHNHEVPTEGLKMWAFYKRFDHVQYDEPTRAYIYDVFRQHYDSFSVDAPVTITHRIWFSPDDIDVKRMITSVFGHNDVMHLAVNLFFFFAFAATVELVVGGLSMLAAVVLLAILSNVFYAFISHMHGVFVPTLGLSGIVFGMMGMFICFMPQANVRCFLWFIVMFKRFAVPAWLITLGYVGWNLYDWFRYGQDSNVNFIVHIAGAAFGYLVGVSIFRISKRRYLETRTVRSMNGKYATGQVYR